MRLRRCETCRFGDEGFCHRDPPWPSGQGSTFLGVAPTMWCGEWKLAWRRFFKLFTRKDQP